MNKNGVVAVVVVVVSIVLIGLWAMRSGEQDASGVDCTTPPNRPTGVIATVQGNTGRLTWAPPQAGDTVTNYVIEVGSTPGSSNQGTFVSPANRTTFEREAAAGTYHVRLFARNACGTSPASEEVTVTIQ
jgi:hypothetical protein